MTEQEAQRYTRYKIEDIELKRQDNRITKSERESQIAKALVNLQTQLNEIRNPNP